MLLNWYKRLTMRRKIVLLGCSCIVALACLDSLIRNLVILLPQEKFVLISLSMIQNLTRESSSINDAFYPPASKKFTAGRAFYLGMSEKYIEYVVPSPIRRFPVLNAENAQKFVFVTAGNNKFHYIAMDAVSRVQRLFPKIIIYYYDLGQTSETTIHKINQICNVKYRKFDFARYPAHVQNFHFYAWKPLLIQEVLQEHPAVIWLDSSVRFLSSNITSMLASAVSNGGFMTFDNCGHSIFAATHEGMYRYLPITRAAAGNMSMRGAGAIYIYQTEQIYKSIMRWWVLCALVQDCIAPTNDLYCAFGKERDMYGKCHRYDQSALNILMAHHYAFDDNVYFYSGVPPLLTVERGSYMKEQLRICINSLHALASDALNGFQLKTWDSI